MSLIVCSGEARKAMYGKSKIYAELGWKHYMKGEKCLSYTFYMFMNGVTQNYFKERGRQKSSSQKTDKTMANKPKRKTNIKHTILMKTNAGVR